MHFIFLRLRYQFLHYYFIVDLFWKITLHFRSKLHFSFSLSFDNKVSVLLNSTYHTIISVLYVPLTINKGQISFVSDYLSIWQRPTTDNDTIVSTNIMQKPGLNYSSLYYNTYSPIFLIPITLPQLTISLTKWILVMAFKVFLCINKI